MNAVKTFFGNKIQTLTDTTLTKQKAVKEINKQCFDLHSQLMNIEDQIASSQVQITELQNAKNEKENEIEKIRHVEGDYNNTEIKKYTEQIKQCEMIIQDKQKEINNMKQKEIELKEMYSQKEIETDKYIQQLQQVSIDTMNFLEKTKSTNILLIRKTYKTLDEVYQKMKSES
jgi:chromosome segregation ATPase